MTINIIKNQALQCHLLTSLATIITVGSFVTAFGMFSTSGTNAEKDPMQLGSHLDSSTLQLNITSMNSSSIPLAPDKQSLFKECKRRYFKRIKATKENTFVCVCNDEVIFIRSKY